VAGSSEGSASNDRRDTSREGPSADTTPATSATKAAIPNAIQVPVRSSPAAGAAYAYAPALASATAAATVATALSTIRMDTLSSAAQLPATKEPMMTIRISTTATALTSR